MTRKINRWPTRPETLVKRFEKAVLEKERVPDSAHLEVWDAANRRVQMARRDLLARISAATVYQAKAKARDQ